jgi:hypothetical protein
MTRTRSSAQLICAIYPSTKGFGYAVFEGPSTLVDW